MSRQRSTAGRRRAGATVPADPVATRTFELRLGNLEWTAPSSPERLARGRRHLLRRVRRTAGAATALCLLGAITSTAVLLITPPVTDAQRLANQIARAHHSPFADLAFPARFSAALTGLEESSGHSRGISVDGAGHMIGHLLTPSRRAELALGYQLASTLYLPGKHGLTSEIERAAVALKLSWGYSREKLVRMFAAIANFGHGYYGLVAASSGYFGCRPAELSWAQMAALAALARSPADDAHFARARADQAGVLRGMMSAGIISRDQVSRALRQPLRLAGGLTARRGTCHSAHGGSG